MIFVFKNEIDKLRMLKLFKVRKFRSIVSAHSEK